jgi:hypothetical protein
VIVSERTGRGHEERESSRPRSRSTDALENTAPRAPASADPTGVRGGCADIAGEQAAKRVGRCRTMNGRDR